MFPASPECHEARILTFEAVIDLHSLPKLCVALEGRDLGHDMTSGSTASDRLFRDLGVPLGDWGLVCNYR